MELLTAKDVEMKVFKKTSFGGYSIADVEEFMNQVADDVESYALALAEQQRRASELEERLNRHEAMAETIKETLILAQKSAQETRDEAERMAETTLAEAENKRSQADREASGIIEAARKEAEEIVNAGRLSLVGIERDVEGMRSELKRRLEELDADSKRRNESIEREVAKRLEAADAEAKKRVETATWEAEKLVAEANERREEVLSGAHSEAIRRVGKATRELDALKNETAYVKAERNRIIHEVSDLLAKFTSEFQRLSEQPPAEPETDEPEGTFILPDGRN
ncbi:MAG: DivIVA domain-containing protein [Synergistaceae bacterium]|jgi:cell division initiation protein|nr:DivIVA domain-containing protein [Synergistaceae bacterium]